MGTWNMTKGKLGWSRQNMGTTRVVNKKGLYVFVTSKVKILYPQTRARIDSIKWIWAMYDDTHTCLSLDLGVPKMSGLIYNAMQKAGSEVEALDSIFLAKESLEKNMKMTVSFILQNVGNNIEWLTNELDFMRSFLKDDAEKQESDHRIQQWIFEITNISYDIVSILEDFTLKIEEKDDKKPGFLDGLHLCLWSPSSEDKVTRSEKGERPSLEAHEERAYQDFSSIMFKLQRQARRTKNMLLLLGDVSEDYLIKAKKLISLDTPQPEDNLSRPCYPI
ncbi:hypothetical protein M9H77_25532 [Catharanthus roseus]|uniref:Uncharacterized protein n=1 Tax=Catharanthus roseus TaxID=4058 RepID=A0ACC0A7E2_CATRO|nr:hypothetical protein M9H77_25532 [Catharanthus roseus]